MDHAIICRHGGLTFIHRNELRNLTASWLHEVCHDVAVKPPLQLLTDEAFVPASTNHRDDARVDIHARGFWDWQQGDIRVFHPNTPSYRWTQVGSLFRRHELEKNENMETVFEVWSQPFLYLWCFLPLVVFSREATIFYSRLANLLAVCHNIHYIQMLSWMCCTISFSLLQSAILAIWGSTTLTFTECPSISTELCLAESHIAFTV